MVSFTNLLMFVLVHCLTASTAADDTLCSSDRCANCDAENKASCFVCAEPIPINDNWFKNCSCTDNCDICGGPGTDECRTCSAGYCIEDESYRIEHYGGLGQCWDLYCDQAQTSSSPLHEQKFSVLRLGLLGLLIILIGTV